ncbi:amidase protein [Niveomyces insectorum RCEF 264]|uniref:Amidase protein n=1 Tax=Niveomyces insectorum RCEF 264 TaxID=1081102 RepID=A0A167VNR9_9HYPO|nr:amidase protein [Niveomyces insectorum RCEF 264]
MSSFLGLQHKRDCKFKQAQRAERIRALPAVYHTPLLAEDRKTLATPVEQLVKDVQSGAMQPLDVLRSYGKAALQAHAKTNCLTEVMLASAEDWVRASSREEEEDDDDDKGPINLKGPLAGVPISLKDTIVVGGYDATVGYSGFTHQEQAADGAAVRLLKDAGAVPFVKTNVPITLLSFESTNDVWGRCTNPHNPAYSPGGDGVVDPSPACRRAVTLVADALRAAGHTVVPVGPDGGQEPPNSSSSSSGIPAVPDPYEGLRLAALLLNADGCQTYESNRRIGEWQDTGARQMRTLAALPAPLRYLYYLWVRYVRRDTVWAGLVRDWGAKSASENWQLVAQREAYRERWFQWWDAANVDVLITPPNATPALPHDAMHDAVSSCGYTFLFNLLDYTAGILPVTRVDKSKDQLPSGFSLRKLNGVAQGALKHYDAEAMHGLPVGVQVVGRRLEEEKVLAAMKRVEDALGNNKYQLLELD